jgi:hypothetical protein
MAAMPSEPTDTDTLPGAPADHTGSDCVDRAGDLVSRDAWIGEAGPLSFDGQAVAVAHTAGLDTHADLAPCRFGHFAPDEFERATGSGYLHRAHLCHRQPSSIEHKLNWHQADDLRKKQ